MACVTSKVLGLDVWAVTAGTSWELREGFVAETRFRLHWDSICGKLDDKLAPVFPTWVTTFLACVRSPFSMCVCCLVGAESVGFQRQPLGLPSTDDVRGSLAYPQFSFCVFVCQGVNVSAQYFMW